MTRDEFLIFSTTGFGSAGPEVKGSSATVGSFEHPSVRIDKKPEVAKISRFDFTKCIKDTGFVRIITVKVKHIQILGTLAAAAYGLFIVFVYASSPTSIEDLSKKAAAAVETTISKGQVFAGTYTVDQERFQQGLAAFRRDNFPAARERFELADPEKRDAATQFYIAYSFYRQGWGRLSNDDELFNEALAALKRVPEIDPDFVASDPDLKLRTAVDLRTELEEGLKVTAADFNPFRLMNERK